MLCKITYYIYKYTYSTLITCENKRLKKKVKVLSILYMHTLPIYKSLMHQHHFASNPLDKKLA